MRIDPSSTIAGMPAVQLRDFLRSAGSSDFYTEWAAERLRKPLRSTVRVLRELVRLGLLRPASQSGRRDRLYERTLEGATFALASAARPIMRASANAHLERFLERVRAVNRDPELLYRVRLVYLFGSMLTDIASVNDVDLAVELEPKEADKTRHFAACDRRITDAMKAGRRFGNIVGERFWPETEVLLVLKARSRAISLHTTRDDILETAPKRLIFQWQQD